MDSGEEIKEEWEKSLINHVIFANEQGFLNENGERTLNFGSDSYIIGISLSLKPSNVIQFPKTK